MLSAILGYWRLAVGGVIIAVILGVWLYIGHLRSSIERENTEKKELERRLDNCKFRAGIFQQALEAEHEIDDNSTISVAPGSYSL